MSNDKQKTEVQILRDALGFYAKTDIADGRSMARLSADEGNIAMNALEAADKAKIDPKIDTELQKLIERVGLFKTYADHAEGAKAYEIFCRDAILMSSRLDVIGKHWLAGWHIGFYDGSEWGTQGAHIGAGSVTGKSQDSDEKTQTAENHRHDQGPSGNPLIPRRGE